MERWEGRVVLLVEAVVQEGADWFVFLELDEHQFMRKDVHVECFGDIHRTLTVRARVELPWHAQAMVASPASGRIAQVLVRPGQTVPPGEDSAMR